jgi:hypothetical protein
VTYLAIAYFTVGLALYGMDQYVERCDRKLDPEFDEDPMRWWYRLWIIPLWPAHIACGVVSMFNRKDNP